MKFLFICIAFFVTNTLIAKEQDSLVHILISAQGNTVKASLTTTENVETLYLKHNKNSTDKLVIMNANAKLEMNIQRTFEIVDEKGIALKLNFLNRSQIGTTYVLLKNVFAQMKIETFYQLYTITKTADGANETKVLLCNLYAL
jgi:iron only hydrogenase large subunit-like protein